jgi:hypothetical protein
MSCSSDKLPSVWQSSEDMSRYVLAATNVWKFLFANWFEIIFDASDQVLENGKLLAFCRSSHHFGQPVRKDAIQYSDLSS